MGGDKGLYRVVGQVLGEPCGKDVWVVDRGWGVRGIIGAKRLSLLVGLCCQSCYLVQTVQHQQLSRHRI